jgi:hypothetical protein
MRGLLVWRRISARTAEILGADGWLQRNAGVGRLQHHLVVCRLVLDPVDELGEELAGRGRNTRSTPEGGLVLLALRLTPP